MTSSNAIAEATPVVDVPAEPTPAAADGLATRSNTAPFEFLPAGETFGVCDVNGVCA
jgi:hypothetical protein